MNNTLWITSASTVFLIANIRCAQAMAGLHGGSRLAPHLLFSDRDFNENDYEALLALDEGIENRRGVCPA